MLASSTRTRYPLTPGRLGALVAQNGRDLDVLTRVEYVQKLVASSETQKGSVAVPLQTEGRLTGSVCVDVLLQDKIPGSDCTIHSTGSQYPFRHGIKLGETNFLIMSLSTTSTKSNKNTK